MDTGKGKCIVIGKNCKIARGVIIIAHDYYYSIFNAVYGILPQNTPMTVIGDNVFIGMNSTILMGSSIRNNVVIGAGTVVLA